MLGCRHTITGVDDNFFQLITLSDQQLFVIENCFETQPQQISCVVDEKKW